MIAAIIVAAGRGERLGGEIPKGLRSLGGQPLYRYSLDAASACDRVHQIVLVIPDGRVQLVQAELEARRPQRQVSLVTGGGSRQESDIRGLEILPAEIMWVAVHDAARPLATTGLFTRVIDGAIERGGAIAAVRATDTIKRKTPGRILRTLPRDESPTVTCRPDAGLRVGSSVASVVSCRSNRVARPKSTIFTSPSVDTSVLAGFRSR